ncbi:poly [ADP-ribose] polymerase tankyrase-2 [Phoenix dactylifera]|uniref:Poly [ADP-ribose] polymerase tankyrase-2 n=1 Tax=Phoenix dactylifera TaxID=42345 RepID=A0A8B7CW47_PHODC|nr:poly [ADP-ribose] polymerase tankyrase-2 [Phoenix dactylifera]
MAVPGRRNGLMDDGEDEEGPFDEVEGEAWDDLDRDVPPHLRALVDAAQRGNVDALRLALDNHSGSIDDPVEDGDTVLHLSCLYGYLPCVQLLLQRGANLESKDEEGAIPLHDACAGGFTDIVQYIINFAGSPDCVERMLNITDAEGDTPLHHAARGEHLDVIRLLLAAGASPKKTNVYGKTPAELADPDTEVWSVLTAAAASVPDAVRCQ